MRHPPDEFGPLECGRCTEIVHPFPWIVWCRPLDDQGPLRLARFRYEEHAREFIRMLETDDA